MHLIINTCLNRLKLLYKLISRYFFCIMTTTCERSRCMFYKKFPKYPIRHSLFKKKLQSTKNQTYRIIFQFIVFDFANGVIK